MGYGDLSHTEVIISHKAKLIRIYETEVWDKSHILWVVVGLVFYSIEWQFQQKKEVKELGHGIWEFIQWPSEHDRFPGGRISYNISRF